jgi:hypothetical protein
MSARLPPGLSSRFHRIARVTGNRVPNWTSRLGHMAASYLARTVCLLPKLSIMGWKPEYAEILSQVVAMKAATRAVECRRH